MAGRPFDLDDLLGAPGGAPAPSNAPPPPPPPPGSPPNSQQASAQWHPSQQPVQQPQQHYAPPPQQQHAPVALNDDPFGFQQQQPRAAPQQPQQAAAQQQYYPPPQQYQQQPAYTVPASAYPPQAPQGYPVQQQPQQPPTPQPLHPQPTPAGYPTTPYPVQQPQQAPYQAAPSYQPQQQPSPQGYPPPGAATPESLQRQTNSMYASGFMNSQSPQAQSQSQAQYPAQPGGTPGLPPAAQQAAPYTAASPQYPPAAAYTVPSTVGGSPAYGYQPSASAASNAPPTPIPNPGQAAPNAAAGAGYSSSYSEEQDRANLERIRRLREQLEREQAAEAAASGTAAPAATSPKSMGGAHQTATVVTAQPVVAADGWPCKACTFKNRNMNATQCEVCEEPRAGYTKASASQSGSAASPVSNASTASRGGGAWTCDMCQGQNSSGGLCRICNAPRPNVVPPPPPAPSASANGAPLPPNVWACKNCTLHNPNALTKCQACDYANPSAPPLQRGYGSGQTGAATATPPAPAGQWSCSACTFDNKIMNAKCEMCQADRPSHISAQLQNYNNFQAQQSTAAPGGAPHNPMDLPLTVNGRRLTQEEQRRLIQQQEELLARIQGRGGPATGASGAGAPATGAGRPAAAVQDDDSSDDEGDKVQWQKDADAKRCTKCECGFGLVVRRHHCRICGFVFCKNCCNNFIKVKPTSAREERVCNDCYKERTRPAKSPPPRQQPAASSASSRPQPARTGYPATMGSTSPPPRAVPCDCAGAAEGFHRRDCVNNRAGGGPAAQTVDFDFY